MSPEARAVLEEIRSGEITTVIVGGSDMNGFFRAKRVPAARFAGPAAPVVEFTEYLWAIDLDEVPQPRPAGYEGWWPEPATGYGDLDGVVQLGTLRRVPWLTRTALALCNYRFRDGRPYDVAPRNVLCRVLERYDHLGLQPLMAPEYEFHVFRETERSATGKGFRNLEPIAPRPMAFGALQAAVDDDLIGPMIDSLGAMRVPVSAWAPEGGAGQYELNLAPAPALEAADRGFLFKQGVKEFCARRGMMATFMAKVGHYGNSLHVHQSVWRGETSAFHDPDAADGMSRLLRHYVAGQVRTLVGFSPIWLPTPAAFKRSRPSASVGPTESWGGDNKTLSIRVLTRDAQRCRIEHRVPGADANVYLVLAAMLAGGLYGIENELEPPPPTPGDAQSAAEPVRVPRTLDEAIGPFEDNPVAHEYLGSDFVRRYAASRRWEVEQFQEAITDWELARYFVRG